MQTIRIEPYKRGSRGAKELALHTGILRATQKQVAKHGSFDTIINWGCSERRFPHAKYINDPEAVAIASNKLLSAQRFGEAHVPQPEFTTDQRIAETWSSEGADVFCRTLLRASGGRGLQLCPADNDAAEAGPDVQRGGDGSESETDHGAGNGGSGSQQRGESFAASTMDCAGRVRRIVPAPLYTKYVKKADEYRVHVFDGEVIDVQQKRKRQEVPNEEVDYQIRNSDNGWVYCRDGVDCPDVVRSVARRAVGALALTFGAVDVGYNVRSEDAVVYEVNTAPGLEGTTGTKYYEAIEGMLPQLRGPAYRRRRA